MTRDPIVALEDVTVRVEGRRILGPSRCASARENDGSCWGPTAEARRPSSGWSAPGASRRRDRPRCWGFLRARRPPRSSAQDRPHQPFVVDLFPQGLRVLDVVLTGTRSVLSPWFQDYEPIRASPGRSAAGRGGMQRTRRAWVSDLQPRERQRVPLARAMVAEPRLLVLDATLCRPRPALTRGLESQRWSDRSGNGPTSRSSWPPTIWRRSLRRPPMPRCSATGAW
jgi:hypothetical protein